MIQAAHQPYHRQTFRQAEFPAHQGTGRAASWRRHPPVGHYPDFGRVQADFLEEIVRNPLGDCETQVVTRFRTRQMHRRLSLNRVKPCQWSMTMGTCIKAVARRA